MIESSGNAAQNSAHNFFFIFGIYNKLHILFPLKFVFCISEYLNCKLIMTIASLCTVALVQFQIKHLFPALVICFYLWVWGFLCNNYGCSDVGSVFSFPRLLIDTCTHSLKQVISISQLFFITPLQISEIISREEDRKSVLWDKVSFKCHWTWWEVDKVLWRNEALVVHWN